MPKPMKAKKKIVNEMSIEAFEQQSIAELQAMVADLKAKQKAEQMKVTPIKATPAEVAAAHVARLERIAKDLHETPEHKQDVTLCPLCYQIAESYDVGMGILKPLARQQAKQGVFLNNPVMAEQEDDDEQEDDEPLVPVPPLEAPASAWKSLSELTWKTPLFSTDIIKEMGDPLINNVEELAEVCTDCGNPPPNDRKYALVPEGFLCENCAGPYLLMDDGKPGVWKE